MSDASTPSRDFLGDADEELVFDEPLAVAAVSPIEPAAEPEAGIAAETAAETGKPRRVSRRGRKSVEEAASPPSDAASTTTPSAEADPADAEEPAGAPAPFPPLGADPAGSKLQPWLLAIVACAMLTSLISLGGLIAVGRTLAHANADRDQVAAQRDALAGVAPLVAHLDAASARLDAASARLPATTAPVAAAPPLTLADIHRELDALKLALGQRQPEGLTSLNGMTRDGFTEVTTKLDRLSDQIGAMGKRGGAVSASPPASRAAYRVRPS